MVKNAFSHIWLYKMDFSISRSSFSNDGAVANADILQVSLQLTYPGSENLSVYPQFMLLCIII